MLSRRDFLKGLAVTAAALSLDPMRGVSAHDNSYINSRLNLSVNKPKDWEFSSIADFSALRERQVLEGILADEAHELRDPSNLPVFLFENSLFRQGEFVPAICLYDEALFGEKPKNQLAAHFRMLERFKLLYQNLQIKAAPKEIHLRSAIASYAKWSYLHKITNGDSHPIEIQSILVFRESRVHTYYLVDSNNTPYISNHIWDEFIDSIAYA